MGKGDGTVSYRRNYIQARVESMDHVVHIFTALEKPKVFAPSHDGNYVECICQKSAKGRGLLWLRIED